MKEDDETIMENYAFETLSTWRELMGYSERDACKALGCSRGAWRGWEAGTQRVPRYIALAMAALSMGMSPYGAPEEDKDKEDDDQ